MVAQSIHIDPQQKARLQRLADSRGRSMAAEIRDAIDRHLVEAPDASESELAELDLLGREAELAFQAMCQELDATAAKLASVLAEIERLRGAAT